MGQGAGVVPMQGFWWSLGVLLWLLRDERHIEAIDLRAIPLFAQVPLGHQPKFFGERRGLSGVAFSLSH